MLVAAAEKMDPFQMMALAGVIIVVTIVVISTRRRAADRGHSPRAYAREQMARLREENEMRDDMQSLMTQLEQLAREIGAQVDTRFAKLEKAIADADARIEELKRLGITVGDAESSRPTEVPAGPEPAEDASAVGEGPSSPSPEPDESTTATAETSEPPTESRPPESSPGAADATDEKATDRQSAYEQRVLDLADAGKSPVDIAREVGCEVGEVELIIKLKRRDI